MLRHHALDGAQFLRAKAAADRTFRGLSRADPKSAYSAGLLSADAGDLSSAVARFRGGIGFQELLLDAARANGFASRSFRDSRSVQRFAFGQNFQAAFSTIGIGGIPSNVASRFLVEGFFIVERTWRTLTHVRDFSDFKTVNNANRECESQA
ncbi:MAG: hypothetical protein AABZ12_07850 [Planctomycetota bacterium]